MSIQKQDKKNVLNVKVRKGKNSISTQIHPDKRRVEEDRYYEEMSDFEIIEDEFAIADRRWLHIKGEIE